MDEFVLIQEVLKHEVNKLKEKIYKICVALQSLLKERENQEWLTTNKGAP